MADRVGTFEVGKEFDALLVDTCLGGTAGPFDVFPGEDDEQRFEKFINLGDDRNLAEVYVQVGEGGGGGGTGDTWGTRHLGTLYVARVDRRHVPGGGGEGRQSRAVGRMGHKARGTAGQRLWAWRRCTCRWLKGGHRWDAWGTRHKGQGRN